MNNKIKLFELYNDVYFSLSMISFGQNEDYLSDDPNSNTPKPKNDTESLTIQISDFDDKKTAHIPQQMKHKTPKFP